MINLVTTALRSIRASRALLAKSDKNLAKDSRGAMMVLGLFVSFFLVGVLYYLVGIGDSIWHREQLLDAADSGAFSAAVMHARGMNILVLINIIMAIILAVLVALRIIQFILLVAIAICYAMSLIPFAGTMWIAWAQTLTATYQGVERVHRNLKPPIYRALETLHCTSMGVRMAVPAAAQARLMFTIKDKHGDPIKGGIVWPIFRQLPTEPESFDFLCGKAGEYAATLVMSPLRSMISPEITSKLSKSFGDITEEFSSYFCGQSDQAPNLEATYESVYPPLDTEDARRCRQGAGQNDLEEGRLRACADATKEQADILQFDSSGYCTNDECKQLIKKSREHCNPSSGSLRNYKWREREITLKRKKVGGTWTTVREEGESKLMEDSERAPCGAANASVGNSWNHNQASALCEEEHAEPTMPGEELSYTEVEEVLSCSKEQKSRVITDAAQADPPETTGRSGQSLGVDDSPPISSGGSSTGQDRRSQEQCFSGRYARSPQRLLPGVHLGEEDFQLRALIYGKGVPTRQEKAVDLAILGRDRGAKDDFPKTLRALGSYQASQS